MSVSVNGVDVTAGPETTSELGAARELLRQRAVAVGILDAGSTEEGTIEQAIEELLAGEVVTPTPTDEECRATTMHIRGNLKAAISCTPVTFCSK